MESLLPAPIGNVAQATADWTAMDRPARLSAARNLIGGEPLTIRVALPDGPGARLLFAQLSADWRVIGVRAVRVGRNDPADLKLIDAASPTPMVAIWYIGRFRCPGLPMCSKDATDALTQMRETRGDERLQLIVGADKALADNQLYIPIAQPLRWSLVAPRLLGYADNAVGIHPLNRLQKATD